MLIFKPARIFPAAREFPVPDNEEMAVVGDKTAAGVNGTDRQAASFSCSHSVPHVKEGRCSFSTTHTHIQTFTHALSVLSFISLWQKRPCSSDSCFLKPLTNFPVIPDITTSYVKDMRETRERLIRKIKRGDKC